MSKGLNDCNFIGNLGRDPDVKTWDDGGVSCSFSIAVNGSKKVNGQWEDHVEWVNIKTSGKTAENCAKYLSKGRTVFVNGRFTTRKVEKDGVTKYYTEIAAREVLFIGGRDESGGGASTADPFDDETPF